MTNQEVFKEYGSEKWVVEQNLCCLLQEYWESYGKKAVEDAKNGYTTSGMPYNPVTFVKKFMKEETYCELEYAEKSKMETLRSNVIDADFTELPWLKDIVEYREYYLCH